MSRKLECWHNLSFKSYTYTWKRLENNFDKNCKQIMNEKTDALKSFLIIILFSQTPTWKKKVTEWENIYAKLLIKLWDDKESLVKN